MSLLPSRSDASAAEEADPRVVGVESDDADAILSALSSETARRLLAELHDEPAPPAELADRVDTSLQNAQYHLENLESAGAVHVVDTAYSEKGREMDVYAPADRPLVIFAGDDDSSSSIRTALTRLLGGFGILALASVAVEQLFGDGVGSLLDGDGGTDGASAPATPTPDEAAAARPGTPAPDGGPGIAGVETETPVDALTETATPATEAGGAAAAGLPPGLLFFLGGATVLVAGFVAWHVTE